MRTVFLTLFFTIISLLCHAPEIDPVLRDEIAERRYNQFEISRFIIDLGYRESNNNWLSVNLIGCFGEWQFAESTLRFLGLDHITLKKFKADPNIFPREKQLEALHELIKVNLSYLSRYEHFIGDTINGVVVTKAGMIAASHLGGAKTLMNFLDSNGDINKEDVLGTSIQDYMERFTGYYWN